MIYEKLSTGIQCFKSKIDMRNLKKMRREKNYSQIKLQHLVGVSDSSIAAYEQNIRIPSLAIAYRLSEVLGCSIDYLIGRSNEIEGYYKLSEEDKNKVVKLIIISTLLIIIPYSIL